MVTMADRFWSKVEKTETCWLWRAGPYADNLDQYGIFQRGPGVGTIVAHRLAWMLSGREIPNGMWLLHTCDVRKCVNPDHLYIGTHEDNMRDMSQRKRSRCSKITHCPAGHPYSKFGSFRKGLAPDRPARRCKLCMDESRKKRVKKR